MNGVSKLFLLQLLPFVFAALFINAGCKTLNKNSSALSQKNDSLNDCEEARHIAYAITNFSLDTPFLSAISQIKERVRKDPGHEHTVSFGRDSLNEVILSTWNTGSRSSGRVLDIENAFADLHNHPNNTPPSSGDLYNLLRNHLRNRRYTMRFILTTGGSLYAFAVTDTAAADRFLINYPAQQLPGYSPLFPDALLDEYREIHQRYGAPEELAMAYLLEKYNVGVTLLKQSAKGNFRKLRAKMFLTRGEKSFTAVHCPDKE